MRIIAGTAKGRRLESFAGKDIRPTPDRVREAMFSALLSRLGAFSGRRVLDLFAGSGALALEALSRGARSALLVDRATQAAHLQRANLHRCGLAERAELISADVLAILPRLAVKGPFDLVFLDPPYGQDLVPRSLQLLATPGLLADDALVCAETARHDPVPDALGRFARVATRSYGLTAIHFFSLASETSSPT